MVTNHFPKGTESKDQPQQGEGEGGEFYHKKSISTEGRVQQEDRQVARTLGNFSTTMTTYGIV